MTVDEITKIVEETIGTPNECIGYVEPDGETVLNYYFDSRDELSVIKSSDSDIWKIELTAFEPRTVCRADYDLRKGLSSAMAESEA
jgi:hypothetical protein